VVFVTSGVSYVKSSAFYINNRLSKAALIQNHLLSSHITFQRNSSLFRDNKVKLATLKQNQLSTSRNISPI